MDEPVLGVIQQGPRVVDDGRRIQRIAYCVLLVIKQVECISRVGIHACGGSDLDFGQRRIEHLRLLSRIESQCFAAASRVPPDDTDTPCVGLADVARAGGKSRLGPRPEALFSISVKKRCDPNQAKYCWIAADQGFQTRPHLFQSELY